MGVDDDVFPWDNNDQDTVDNVQNIEDGLCISGTEAIQTRAIRVTLPRHATGLPLQMVNVVYSSHSWSAS